jgi:hypothetical protein
LPDGAANGSNRPERSFNFTLPFVDHEVRDGPETYVERNVGWLELRGTTDLVCVRNSLE